MATSNLDDIAGLVLIARTMAGESLPHEEGKNILADIKKLTPQQVQELIDTGTTPMGNGLWTFNPGKAKDLSDLYKGMVVHSLSK